MDSLTDNDMLAFLPYLEDQTLKDCGCTHWYPEFFDLNHQDLDGPYMTAEGPGITIAHLPPLRADESAGGFGEFDNLAWDSDLDKYIVYPGEQDESNSTFAFESNSQQEESGSELNTTSDESSSCRCSKKVDAMDSRLSVIIQQMKSIQEKLDQFAEGLSAFSFDVYRDMQSRSEWRERREGGVESLRIGESGLTDSETLDIGQTMEEPEKTDG